MSGLSFGSAEKAIDQARYKGGEGRSKRYRCWFSPEELKTGPRLPASDARTRDENGKSRRQEPRQEARTRGREEIDDQIPQPKQDSAINHLWPPPRQHVYLNSDLWLWDPRQYAGGSRYDAREGAVNLSAMPAEPPCPYGGV